MAAHDLPKHDAAQQAAPRRAGFRQSIDSVELELA